MVRSSQVSPLDIQIKKRPADIFIPPLPNPTHYPFLSSVFYLHFSPPRWGEESGNGHEIPQPPAFMCLASLRTWEIYHFFMSPCLLWLTLITKVYNHYRAEYIIAKAFFTSAPTDKDRETSGSHLLLCLHPADPHWKKHLIKKDSSQKSCGVKKNKNITLPEHDLIFTTWCSRTRDIFLSHILLPYLNLVPTLPTIQQFSQRPGYVMQVAANVV